MSYAIDAMFISVFGTENVDKVTNKVCIRKPKAHFNITFTTKSANVYSMKIKSISF